MAIFNERFLDKIFKKRKFNNIVRNPSDLKKHGLITKEEYDYAVSVYKKYVSKIRLFDKYFEHNTFDHPYNSYAKDPYFDYIDIGYVLRLDQMDKEAAIAFGDGQESEELRARNHLPKDIDDFEQMIDDTFDKLVEDMNKDIKRKYDGIVVSKVPDTLDIINIRITSKKPKDDEGED